MIKDYLGILDNHVQAIKEADSTKSSNEVLLETIKLLLDNLDYSNSALSGYDKMGMRELFSSFGKIAQSTCDFYQASKIKLDPVALTGEIGQRLERTTSKLSETIDLIEKIDRDNAELLKQESELEKKENIYRKKEEKISSLREKSRLYTDKSIEALDDENKKLEEEIEKNKPLRNELEDSIKKLEDSIKKNEKLDAELSNTIVRLENKKREIEETIISKIEERRDEILEIFNAHSKDLNEIIDEIISYKKQYADLQESHKIFNLHFGENSQIANKLLEYEFSSKILSVEALRDEIPHFYNITKNELEKIERELKKFDNILKDIIVEQEKVKEKINELQKNN